MVAQVLLFSYVSRLGDHNVLCHIVRCKGRVTNLNNYLKTLCVFLPLLLFFFWIDTKTSSSIVTFLVSDSPPSKFHKKTYVYHFYLIKVTFV